MKIVTDTPNALQFGHLNPGDTFAFSGNDYVKLLPHASYGSGSDKAARLRDGQVGTFNYTTAVVATKDSAFYRNAKD